MRTLTDSNLKQGCGPQDTKSEIVLFSPHLTRNLRSQKENADLVKEEHKTNTVPQVHQFRCLSWIQVFFTNPLDNLMWYVFGDYWYFIKIPKMSNRNYNHSLGCTLSNNEEFLPMGESPCNINISASTPNKQHEHILGTSTTKLLEVQFWCNHICRSKCLWSEYLFERHSWELHHRKNNFFIRHSIPRGSWNLGIFQSHQLDPLTQHPQCHFLAWLQKCCWFFQKLL